MVVEILLALALAASLYFAFTWHRELKRLRETYSGIISVDEAIAKARQEGERQAEELSKRIEALTKEKAEIEADFDRKKTELQHKYAAASDKYNRLNLQVSALEETLEMMDFGMYKPHYDFTTSDAYKAKLEEMRTREKVLIKNEQAVICKTEWTVGGSAAEGRKMTKQTHKLMLRAFNGECDAALAKVRWDNILKMEERVRKAAEAINKSAEVNQSYINPSYVELKISELRLTHELAERLQQEKEEQKRIQEEMREEEKARREIEKAKEAAEKEEARYQKALDKAREELKKAGEGKAAELASKIAELEAQLASAQEMKQRAISQAQLTKAGHVYVISNIGSFGEDFYKIGMTRRLDPLDRVKELGDASVPFEFDVHAMVYSENAPELERKLHLAFAGQRINLVNPRKEFFQVTLDQLETWAASEMLDMTITKVAEARAYRESMAIREQGLTSTVAAAMAKEDAVLEPLFDD